MVTKQPRKLAGKEQKPRLIDLRVGRSYVLGRVKGVQTILYPDQNARSVHNFEKCVTRAAANSDVTIHRAAIVLANILQEIAGHVANGEEVTIPGFGLFCPWINPKANPKKFKFGICCQPIFVAGKHFRSEVAYTLPPERVERAREFYRANSTERNPKLKVFTQMRKAARRWEAQDSGCDTLG